MSVLSVSRPPDKEAALDTFNLFPIIIVVIIMIAVTVTIVSLLSRINKDCLLYIELTHKLP